MKDFIIYPVDGNTAIKVDAPRYSNENENVIEFPGNPPASESAVGYSRGIACTPRNASLTRGAHARVDLAPQTAVQGTFDGLYHAVANHPFVEQLRYGTVKGVPFDRMTKAQAFVGGTVLSAIALCSIYIGL